jgi:hypothetical protein
MRFVSKTSFYMEHKSVKSLLVRLIFEVDLVALLKVNTPLTQQRTVPSTF